MVQCVGRMPAELRQVLTVRQQLAWALNRRADSGDREIAIEILRGLIDDYGPDPETNGILGRVYKDLWDEAEAEGATGKAEAALEAAIKEYEVGFNADPRDYYPGVNLLTLLRRRGGEEDLARVQELQPVVLFATARRGGLASSDYWDVATVLELAIIGEDKDLAERALGKIELLGPQDWERETTARNLRLLAEKTEDSAWIPELAERLAP
jgi:tetratricopeptide (TPR) repeat protein